MLIILLDSPLTCPGRISLVALHLPPTDVSGGGLVSAPGPGCHVGFKIFFSPNILGSNACQVLYFLSSRCADTWAGK